MDFWAKLLVIGVLVMGLRAQLDGSLTIQERCERYGFGYEEYQVTTEDGYILTLMRIPYSPDNPSTENRPPVLMVHPLNADSAAMVGEGPDFSPAFSLSNRGFDIWLNNFRYTSYSRAHTTLDPDTDQEYWDFDIVDLRHDLMAEIMFILNNTNYDSLATYSYSFGGVTTAFAMALEPEFFEPRINLAGLMVTPVSLAHSNSILLNLVAYLHPMMDYLRTHGMNVMMAYDSPMGEIGSMICVPFPYLCDGLLSFVMGESDPTIDHLESVQNLMLSGAPATLQLFQHYVQSARTQRVSQFDYGPQGNLERYGVEVPPLIPLENTINRVALVNADIDVAVTHEDMQWYADILGDLVVDWQYYPISHSGLLGGDTDEYLTDLAELYNAFQEPSDQ
ncbi:unnamed protein product [Moneuplotes crassus]|uniref:Partial AB-hydrolase lipase domain-containing protein n=1 Tax=Euplotes crassus TaxID=5936 RepID=A0AAD1UHK1_EUPCR|nr:unnamed protein product [Moneuplotes crassus]